MKRFVTQYPVRFGFVVLALHMLIDPQSGWSQLPLQVLYLRIADYWHIPAYLSPNCLLPTYLVVNSVIALGLAASMRWCDTGVLSRISWRQSYLLGLPIAAAIWPLAFVPINVGGRQIIFVLISALLTALCNELLYRGVILGALLPGGKVRACLISALLSVGFYLPILNNLPTLLRTNSPDLLLLLIIIFSIGLSFAALRLRLNSVWPLVGVHTLSALTLLSIDMAQLSWTVAVVGIILPYSLLTIYGWHVLRADEHAAVRLRPALLEQS
jgi:hypothetical protein